MWCLALLYIPPLQVLVLRFVNSPITAPALINRISGTLSRKPKNTEYKWTNLAGISPEFTNAVLFAEDQDFFAHHGFDFPMIRMYIEESWQTGKPPKGASTITQQCARSVFLWQGRSWIRKGLEAYYTVWMELFLSKNRILELYANSIEFGDGVYGVHAAASYYYHVSARQLTREQIAMLVAIMPSPRKLSPKQPTQALLKRQQWILNYLKTTAL